MSLYLRDLASRKGSWIETYSGRKFWPLDPRQEDVYLGDIAHALSQTCRYLGHTRFFYSVGEHSINVQKYLANRGYSPLLQLLGLLHDASEAYVCDIVRPVKSSIRNYKKIEERVEVAILAAFDLSSSKEDERIVKEADNAMLSHEAAILMHCNDWNDNPTTLDDILIVERPMRDVEAEFLKIAKELFAAVHKPVDHRGSE